MSKRTIRTDLFDEVQKRLQHMQSTVDWLEGGDRSCLSLDELTAELQYLCESVEMGRLLFQTSLSDASANLDSVYAGGGLSKGGKPIARLVCVWRLNSGISWHHSEISSPKKLSMIAGSISIHSTDA